MVDALRLCCKSSFVIDGRPNGMVKVEAYRELIYTQMGFFSVFLLPLQPLHCAVSCLVDRSKQKSGLLPSEFVL